MKLYYPEQVYELDRKTIEQDGQSSSQLMYKAALATWRQIQMRWPEIKHILVIAGPGNNGGDAFAVACLALQSGLEVSLIAMGDLSRQSDESLFYRNQWESAGGITESWDAKLPQADLIVDGLLGIGLNKELDNKWCVLIHAINEHSALKVAVDIPSGLNARTGVAMPQAVVADLTVSFIGRKLGCYLADGADYCGERIFDDLGLTTDTHQKVDFACNVLHSSNIHLPAKRKKNSHKNQFGHVLVIGGDVGMSGAVRLAGLAALRSGAGLVSCCVHPENYQIVAAQHAELMVSVWDKLLQAVQQASVIVVGPGLGQSAQAVEVLNLLKTIDKPMVIDADALQATWLKSLNTHVRVLTPHPGEAARILEQSTASVQQDRMKALQLMMQKYNSVSIVKGYGTLIGQPGLIPDICLQGHAGMASAGMGDVLAGLIGGYLAQGLSPLRAAQTAVYIHASSAEKFAQKYAANSLIASDIIKLLPSMMKSVHQLQESA